MHSSRQDTPIFLDIEASGLGPDSWPIEIGLAWITPTGCIDSAARLIAPDPAWPEHGWSGDSARIHCIPRTRPDTEGIAAREVATWLVEMLDGRAALCDAPEFDGKWMMRLLDRLDARQDAASAAPWPIHWQEALIAHKPEEVSYDRALRRAETLGRRLPVPHRADADAARLARMWCAALEIAPPR